MKEISEAIKKLTPEDFKELAARLQLKNKSKKDLVGALMSISGMHALLKTLDANCHRVLKTVYAAPEGASFVEIHKELKLEIPVIEKTAETLTRCLLMYITKNRQMLNSKMDKAYGIAELAPFIHIVEPKSVTDRLHKNYLHLETQKQSPPADRVMKDRDVRTVLAFMAQSGCVATLDAVRDRLPQKSAEKLLAGMVSQNLVTVYQCYRPEFNTYLVLQDKISQAAAALDEHDESRKKPGVSNRYFLIHNLLHTFDVISTFGLFLTKQQDFRKIDIRRISEVMLPLRDPGGAEIPLEESAQLAMFLLNRLGCLKLNKDIAGISLHGIKSELEQPLLLVKRILKSASPGGVDPFFKPPFDTPAYELCKSIIKLLYKLRSASHSYLQITMLTRALSEADERQFGDGPIVLEERIEPIATAINFLCLAGIVDIEGGKLMLSDIGRDLANNMLKTYPAEEPAGPKKNIYINPDFTLIIPAQELPSETLYHLLTHTDITKHDVIINAVINKAAIVRAQKRGMTLNRFLDSLGSYSRNDLPQNLNFLLREWSNQTIAITISQSILLISNHHEFIDELMLGLAKEGIMERISQTHALIKKDYIDEIIKIARKKDAVISLFSELEEED